MDAQLRHLQPQRSLARKWLAALFVIVGLVCVGIAYVPDAWLAATGSVLTLLPGLLSAVGPRPLVLTLAAGCLIVGGLVFVTARPRRHAYDLAPSDIVAPVSVYLDAENQLLSPQEVRTFISRLRQHLGGRRADLLYYTDAGAAARTRTYRILYRFGFRPIDVPHRPLGVGSAKNIVDVELALHAYQRALLGPPSQEVILVSADRDYLPLVYRLRAMEFPVGVWANRVPAAFKALQDYLGIQVVEFGVEPRLAGGGLTATSDSTKQPRGLQEPVQQVSMPTVPLPAALESITTLAQVLSFTLDLIQEVSRPDQTAEERFTLVRQRSGLRGYDVAHLVGYETKNRMALWLAHVRALGIITGGPLTTPLSPGPVTVEEGVKLFERFLGELRAQAEKLAALTAGRRVKLTTLCRHVSHTPSASANDSLKGLRKHLRASLDGNPAVCVTEMQGLCRLSKLVGVRWFEETPSPNVIVVAPPRAE